MLLTIRCLLLTLLSAVVACGAPAIEPADADATGKAEVPAEFAAVHGLVMSFGEERETQCTAFHVGEGYLLTAAHCLTASAKPLAKVEIFTGSTINLRRPRGQAKAYWIHPSYASTSGANKQQFDLAMLHAPAFAGAVAMTLSEDGAYNVKDQATIVGFGDRDRKLGEIIARIFVATFFGIVAEEAAAEGKLRPPRSRFGRALRWKTKQGEQKICRGDSGGPLIVDQKVLGVAVSTQSWLFWQTCFRSLIAAPLTRAEVDDWIANGDWQSLQ
ncbi:MAG: trypsin-like serine protease [Deltaproteobacteria bacterium]|nr:trypsin-like serine protease [Deltaproteobacteria bacterium]